MSALGIVKLIIMNKVYYEHKHLAEFGSVAKLVKAGKINEREVTEWLWGQN